MEYNIEFIVMIKMDMHIGYPINVMEEMMHVVLFAFTNTVPTTVWIKMVNQESNSG